MARGDRASKTTGDGSGPPQTGGSRILTGSYEQPEARMPRPRVMLVEARDALRESYCTYLQGHFDVDPLPLGRHALAAFQKQAPDAVVANIRQPGGDAVELFAQLRALPGGEDCVLLLYGHPFGPRPSRQQAERICREARADQYLARELDPNDLEQVLALELLGPDTECVSDAISLEDVQLMSARRGEERPTRVGAPTRSGRAWSLLAALLGKTGGVIDRLPTHRDVSWGELVRARPSLHNLYVLLTKPVTPLVERLPEDRPPSLAEIARARASVHNLRVLLKSRGGPGSVARP